MYGCIIVTLYMAAQGCDVGELKCMDKFLLTKGVAPPVVKLPVPATV